MRRRHLGKENQPPLTNDNENLDAANPETSEKRLEQKRRYNKRAYQEMSREKKEALLLRNRTNYQQRTRENNNNCAMPNLLEMSIFPGVPITSQKITRNNKRTYENTDSQRNQGSSCTPLSVHVDATSILDPNRASDSSNGTFIVPIRAVSGVPTRRKRIYNKSNTQPHVLVQNDNVNESNNFCEDEINILDWHEEAIAPVITEQCEDTFEQGESSYDPSSIDASSIYAHGSDPFDFVYQGLPSMQSLLKEPTYCTYCGAKKFQYECPTFCCMNGKTELASSSVPDALYYLFTTKDKIGVDFRHYIRSYNTHFSFTSFGVQDAKRKKKTNNGVGLTNKDSNCGGVYNFRVHGQIYHFIDQLVPRDGKLPEYLQLYFYDTESELDHRLQRMPSLNKDIVAKLMIILSVNPYSKVFRSLGELRTLDTCGITLNASVELDQRVYNKPTKSQVAAVWVEGNGENSAFRRSIVVFGRSFRSSIVNYHFGCYDPLAYPLFFPNGEVGWHPKIPRVGVSIDSIIEEDYVDEDEQGFTRRKARQKVSVREYYCYKLQIRSGKNLLLLGGRLLQQFVVDMYVKVETSRLDWILKDQSQFRSEIYQGIVDSVTAGEARADMIGQRVILPSSFIGGPRDMRRRFMDAMALVTRFGRPDIFLTMTCNPDWEEIRRELLPGQQAQDRPDLIARIFHSKLEDLKVQLFKKNFFGVVAARVHVIEFQKRGLPHAHFLIILAPGDKLKSPDMYDKFVCAEISDPHKYPELYKLVVKHMLHGPCGVLQPGCPCMKNGGCRFSYPKQFSEVTIQGKDSYPVYRRRNNGRKVKVRGAELDNRWVVPYNPHLLVQYNCHINVEICSSIQAVKYLFKYIYKGHDRTQLAIESAIGGNQSQINEIRMYQDARWVSAPEAMWRLFGFALSEIHPSVRSLWLHCPNEQTIRFAENQNLYDLAEDENEKRTMLTEFFEMNKIDPDARRYLYKEFPEHFTWNSTHKKWKRRQRGSEVGRIVTANPSHGDRYYLRILLNHVRGPTSFGDLLMVDGVLHNSFRESAEARGLIEMDNSLSRSLSEAANFQFPSALRRLFATILVYCEPGNVRELWDEHFDELSEDYRREYNSLDLVQQLVLKSIDNFLQSMGRNVKMYDLLELSETGNFDVSEVREVVDEMAICVDEEHLNLCDSLNPEQLDAFHEIMQCVVNKTGGVFFIDGPGGTGCAANNMLGGRTAHSRFKIPLKIENNSICNIKKQSGIAHLLRLATLIIWDEASMSKRQAIEALDRTMRDIIGQDQPFGGKIVIFGGDFRQVVLPVVRKGTRAQIVDSSLRMSLLWPSIKKIHLTRNMRSLSNPCFSDYLLRVGNGTKESLDGELICIPEELVIPYNKKGDSKQQLIDSIYPSLDLNGGSLEYITSRAILSTRNEYVDELNQQMIETFPGDEMIYYSFDKVEDDTANHYTMEFLNSLAPSGLPPHILKLKLGCLIILLRNLDPSNGLCNGTRLICRNFQNNAIDAEIAIGQHAGKRIFLPRLPMCPSDDEMFPFKLLRKQFPIRLSFAMTINKAQGQTIPNVGIYLPEPVFSHGQLYVALSRGISQQTTKVMIKPTEELDDPGVYTKNIVYREVLSDE